MCVYGASWLPRTRNHAGRHRAGIPRLYDLVKIKDDRLRPAFFYAMQNTLVADTLDQAARISYSSERKFKRVVTLQVSGRGAAGRASGEATFLHVVTLQARRCSM